MHKAWKGMAAALPLLMAGCAEYGAMGTVAGEPFPGLCRCNGVTDLLVYQRRLRAMNGDELNAEYAAVNQGLIKYKSDSARLRLAMLVSLPGTAFRDDGRAAMLAEEVSSRKNPDSHALWPLAAMIAANVSEQRRQEERNQKLAQKLQEEEKRADALQQKLDGLKAIEKTLLNREPAKPVNVK